MFCSELYLISVEPAHNSAHVKCAKHYPVVLRSERQNIPVITLASGLPDLPSLYNFITF